MVYLHELFLFYKEFNVHNAFLFFSLFTGPAAHLCVFVYRLHIRIKYSPKEDGYVQVELYTSNQKMEINLMITANLTVCVILEPVDDQSVVYVRRKCDGYYLSAHENMDTMYWTRSVENISTWEQYTIDTENDNRLKTSHGTYVVFANYGDGHDTMWQVDNDYRDEDFENAYEDCYTIRLQPAEPGFVTFVRKHEHVVNISPEEEEDVCVHASFLTDPSTSPIDIHLEHVVIDVAPPTAETIITYPNKPSAYMVNKARTAFANQLQLQEEHQGMDEKAFKQVVRTQWKTLGEAIRSKLVAMIGDVRKSSTSTKQTKGFALSDEKREQLLVNMLMDRQTL